MRSLLPPATGAYITYDAEIAGFGVRVTSAGSKSFVLNYVALGRERRMTIGSAGAWSVVAAREEAAALRRQIDGGHDPLQQKANELERAASERSAPTVQDLFDRYEREHLPHKSSRAASDDRGMWTNIILPSIGTLKLSAVSHSDIDRLHATITETRPVRANRVIEVVRKAFNLAIRWGWCESNPAIGVRRNREERRETFLNHKQLQALLVALASHPERASADAIALLALTGARKSEVLRATWDQFDLETGIWTKPSSHTKQRKVHRVPLSAAAVRLLQERLRAKLEGTDVTNAYVFLGHSGKPLVDVKRTWLSACRLAGLVDRSSAPPLRMHDLRHSFASILASNGQSLPVIGALLGHTQAQTTSRYAHLLDDPLRSATEFVGKIAK